MTWTEYSYTPIGRKDGRVVKKPFLEVEVAYGGAKERQLAIVDSGADMTLISSDVAKLLGIKTKGLEKTDIGGIMESTPYAHLR